MINQTLNEADSKMDKAVEVTREDFAAIRTGRAQPVDVPQAHRRLLRHADAAAAARVVHRARGAGHHHQPVRPERDGSIEKAIRDSDLGVNPTDDGKTIRVTLPGADRGAPQGLHQDGQGQGRGRPGLGPQHPPQRQAGAGEAGEGRRGRQGRRHRRREAARRHHQEAHRRDRRACSSTRKPSCSRSERPPTTDDLPDAPPAPATPAAAEDHGRAGRNLPAAIASGVVLGVAIIASLVFWKTAFMVIVVAAVLVAVWELGHAASRPVRSTCPQSR